MTEQEYYKSIETGELQLNFWGKFTHFSIVGYLFIIPIVLTFLHLWDYLGGNAYNFKEGETWFFIVPSILGILFYLLQKRRLRFRTITSYLTKKEIKKVLTEVGIELKLIVVVRNDEMFLAKTNPGFFSGSWGEQITVLFDGNRILINSICDLDSHSSVVSMGRNAKNVRVIMEYFDRAEQAFNNDRGINKHAEDPA